jgi:predicted hydrocarbon binding protein
MATTTTGAPPETALLSWRCIHTLRLALERDAGPQAAGWMQEAGFAGGEALSSAFTTWLAAGHSVNRPAALDIRHLGELLSQFFQDVGFGAISMTPLSPAVMAIDSGDWWESDPAAAAAFPACHLSSGLIADFLSRVAETPLGLLEVECRSRGDAQCRFLIGAPDTLQTIYGRMTEGAAYLDALGTAG